MTNKICGECCYFVRTNNYDMCAMYAAVRKESDCISCEYFTQKVITNGDKVRQMSNEDLAKVLSDGCPPLGEGDSYKCKHPYPDSTCKDCWHEWLNAPAEKRGK